MSLGPRITRLVDRPGARSGARFAPGALLGVLAATALGLSAPAAAATVRTRHHPRPDKVLSNETTHTTWSIADVIDSIRAQPSPTARVLAQLQYMTPDDFLQSYVLLRERRVGRTNWVKLRIPMRPNGKVGWVLRRDLDQFQVLHTEMVVNRAARQLTLLRNGKVIYRAPVGVGKPGTPTPPGHFWITESFSSNVPAYGPWAFGTSDYSTLTDWPGGGIVGLHGTDQPGLVPGDPSHGCIRLHNADALALSHLVPIGTPLLVL